jgi:tRNA threonylcarbamoyladenosine biosynthesis protein TsaE
VTARSIVTRSEDDTIREAAAMAVGLNPGAIVLLSGELGAGKTAFVRGLAEGLGIDAAEVTSPTFTLVHEYRGGRLPLIHVDLYRLERAELDDLGLDDDLASRGVLAIEWPERLSRVPAGHVDVRIIDTGGETRVIEISPVAAGL